MKNESYTRRVLANMDEDELHTTMECCVCGHNFIPRDMTKAKDCYGREDYYCEDCWEEEE